jgi:hypothetical protein
VLDSTREVICRVDALEERTCCQRAVVEMEEEDCTLELEQCHNTLVEDYRVDALEEERTYCQRVVVEEDYTLELEQYHNILVEDCRVDV